MEYVTRINLKTGCCKDRKKLVDFCLNNKKQYLAIGWSKYNVCDFKVFYDKVKKETKKQSGKTHPALNRFNETFDKNKKENDLFWTRDLDGCYWICRAIDCAKTYCDEYLDIGAVIPIKAYKVGLEVPGQIKASFNRRNGGTVGRIYDKKIIEYSKYIFNKYSKTNHYTYNVMYESILDNLPDFELEELIIIYLQIMKDYYVLSNSIARKSTTVKVECELISRQKGKNEKAVVQVGGKNKFINAIDYKEYAKDGYLVYFYAPLIENIDTDKNFKRITQSDVMNFYKEYKSILPKSITEWESLFI